MMGGSWVLVWIKERTQILSQTLPLQFYAMLHGEKKKKSYWTFSSSSIFSPTSWVITKSKTKQNTPNVHVHAVLWRCKILYVVLGYHFSKNKQTKPNQLFCKHSNSEARLQWWWWIQYTTVFALGRESSPSLLQRWRRIEAVVIAVREILGTVGVTSTFSTFWPSCDASGASKGSEFFMAFAT